MLTIEQIKNRFAVANLKLIAKQSNLKYSTVLNIAKGKIRNPRVSDIKAISDLYIKIESAA